MTYPGRMCGVATASGGAVRDGVGGEGERLAQIGRAVVHARQHV